MVYGPAASLAERARLFGLRRPEDFGVHVVDIPVSGAIELGQTSAAAGRAAAQAVLKAAEDAKAGLLDGLVTAPLNKASLAAAGYPSPGHTEMLGRRPGPGRGDGLPRPPVAHGPAHHPSAPPLEPDAVTGDEVRRVVRLVRRELPGFGAPDRRIALCGINPHAGEGGLFGREEIDVLGPAVAALRPEGIDVEGPHPADSLFVRAARGEFDAVIAGYHDQGLIPVKLAAFGHAVNVTLGLPFVRTSVDHGTGFDIVTRGVADGSSLVEAMKTAVALIESRRRR